MCQGGNESNYTIFINILLNKMRFKPPRDERRVLAQSQKVTVWAATPHCANAVYRRHPVITPDERLRFSIVPWRVGISLGKNRFCSVSHNALFFREQNHRGTHQCSRWVPLFYKALLQKCPDRRIRSQPNHTVQKCSHA